MARRRVVASRVSGDGDARCKDKEKRGVSCPLPISMHHFLKITKSPLHAPLLENYQPLFSGGGAAVIGFPPEETRLERERCDWCSLATTETRQMESAQGLLRRMARRTVAASRVLGDGDVRCKDKEKRGVRCPLPASMHHFLKNYQEPPLVSRDILLSFCTNRDPKTFSFDANPTTLVRSSTAATLPPDNEKCNRDSGGGVPQEEGEGSKKMPKPPEASVEGSWTPSKDASASDVTSRSDIQRFSGLETSMVASRMVEGMHGCLWHIFSSFLRLQKPCRRRVR
ncbi:hypothetical protein LXL04_007419 [Taraxacum kok-saghyz]